MENNELESIIEKLEILLNVDNIEIMKYVIESIIEDLEDIKNSNDNEDCY